MLRILLPQIVIYFAFVTSGGRLFFREKSSRETRLGLRLSFLLVINLFLCLSSFQSFIDTMYRSPQYRVRNTFCKADLVSFALK